MKSGKSPGYHAWSFESDSPEGSEEKSCRGSCCLSDLRPVDQNIGRKDNENNSAKFSNGDKEQSLQY